MDRAARDARQLYAMAHREATRFALRHLNAGEASEIAHDVATGVVNWMLAGNTVTGDDRALGALVYRAVINRLRDRHRSSSARSSAEQMHAIDRAAQEPGWASPSAILEAEELADVMQRTVSAMPAGMRQVFQLVREQELSYKEVAARLTITVGTVHTQLSRANALLREAVVRYRDVEVPNLPARAAAKLRTSA